MLEALAEAINKKWPNQWVAEYSAGPYCPTISINDGYADYDPLSFTSDHAQSNWIIWCLYQMWDMGKRCALAQSFKVVGGDVTLRWCIHVLNDDAWASDDFDTAAEACANALYVALGREA